MIKLDTNLLKQVEDIALAAGKEILRVYGQTGEIETSYKDDHSPLTIADRRAHDLIENELTKRTPEIPVISEESQSVDYDLRKSWKQFWLVDPLDGTKEFLKRNGEFTVNIALIEDCRPVLGVVYAPALASLYSAVKGAGAFVSDSKGRRAIRTADYRQGGLVIAASRSHSDKKLADFLAAVQPVRLLSVGSALKICLVAEGSAHLYPRFGPTMEWDTGAAHCVLAEAGGTLRTLSGETLAYNRKDMLNPGFFACGSPPFPWQEYLSETPDAS